jgi:hypothetical protein
MRLSPFSITWLRPNTGPASAGVSGVLQADGCVPFATDDAQL